MASWVIIKKVRSASVKNKVYLVQVRRGGDSIRCIDATTKKTCLGFRYSAVKWCRHTEQAFGKGGR